MNQDQVAEARRLLTIRSLAKFADMLCDGAAPFNYDQVMELRLQTHRNLELIQNYVRTGLHKPIPVWYYRPQFGNTRELIDHDEVRLTFEGRVFRWYVSGVEFVQDLHCLTDFQVRGQLVPDDGGRAYEAALGSQYMTNWIHDAMGRTKLLRDLPGGRDFGR